MDLQNLSYAATQIVHNFGAVAVVGAPVCAWMLVLGPGLAGMRQPLSWAVLAGWVAQAASGAAFGGVSWLYYGRLPDIHGLAITALLIKIACAAASFALVTLYLYRGKFWREQVQRATWLALGLLGATALTAAAVLRWFS